MSKSERAGQITLRDLSIIQNQHLSIRRQRQMCIRDSSGSSGDFGEWTGPLGLVDLLFQILTILRLPLVAEIV